MLHPAIRTVTSMTCKDWVPKMVFSVLIAATFIGCRREQPEVRELDTELISVSTELKAAQRRNDSLEQLIENSGSTERIPVYFGKAFDTIENPEEYISDALRQQREKIPIDGVLGGNMEIRQVEVLTEDWVLAIYDDGHIQGKSVYKFELQAKGDLKFTEIVSKLPNRN